MQENIIEANHNYQVVFIREEEHRKSTAITKIISNYVEVQRVNLSAENVAAIEAVQLVCNVLVVLFFGKDLYSIGEVKINNQKRAGFVNGVYFSKFTMQKLIDECIHDKLTEYLKRLNQKKEQEFSQGQKIEFVQLCCQTKWFPNLFIRSEPIPMLYQCDENKIIKIESPITKVIPQLLELEERMPINEKARGFVVQSNGGVTTRNHKVYKRVIKEIIDVNNDFHSLRTVVTPSVSGNMNLFNFVMYPNDGAFCSLPLIGRIIIPQTYPTNPPVFHLFTRTNRRNLDVYHGYVNDVNHSSICFDLVKPISNPESAWRPEFTISTVFASIMSVIVSFKVDQMWGGTINQAVTMESLERSMKNVQTQILNRWKLITKLPTIPIVKAVRHMCDEIKFKRLEEWEDYQFIKKSENIISEPITLQKNCWTAEFKLKNLSPEFVLSFILTNDPTDFQGQKPETIIFRNGVTATAAKKLVNQNLNWFYHGKPLNNGDMCLNITITEKQFVFSFQDESTNGEWIVHGDTPVTCLGKKHVGDLTGQKFYLMIYVKNKNIERKGKFCMTQVFTNTGYIHKACEQNE